MITGNLNTYGACVDAAEYQPFIDELNAATGMSFAIPPRGAAQ